MQQFQVELVRLTGRTRQDEETLTDVLNERARAGWQLHSTTEIGGTRVMFVFQREA